MTPPPAKRPRVMIDDDDSGCDTPRFGATSNSKSPGLLARLGRSLFGGNAEPSPDVQSKRKHVDMRTPELSTQLTSEVDEATSMPTFCYLPDFASRSLGGRVLFATDEFFGRAENLLSPEGPQPSTDLDERFGPNLDAWLTRRRRSAGHDWIILELAHPVFLRGFDLDLTAVDEFAPNVSIEGGYFKDINEEFESLVKAEHPQCMTDGRLKSTFHAAPYPDELIRRADAFFDSKKWVEILRLTRLKPQDRGHNYFAVNANSKENKLTHLRINIFPDGGIHRLRAYGEATTSAALMKLIAADTKDGVLNMLTPGVGGSALWASSARGPNMVNVIHRLEPDSYRDAWITTRQPFRPLVLLQEGTRFTGQEYLVLKLSARCVPQRLELSSAFLMGSSPASIVVQALDDIILHSLPAVKQIDYFRGADSKEAGWFELVPELAVLPHAVHEVVFAEGEKFKPVVTESLTPDETGHVKVDVPATSSFVTHLRLLLIPDGGISRVRLFSTAEDIYVPDASLGLSECNLFVPTLLPRKKSISRRRNTALLYNTLAPAAH